MVDTHQLYERIKVLPDNLVKQVAEYVDFLMLKNRVELNPSGELSDKVKSELDSRYQEYLNNPDSAMTLDSVKEDLLKKYGKA